MGTTVSAGDTGSAARSTAAAGSTGASGTDGGAETVGLGGASGAAGTGDGRNDCTSDSDCPPVRCAVATCPDMLCSLGGDGFHHCVPRSHPALDACQGDAARPCCTSDAACSQQPNGMCVPSLYGYCGGPPVLPGNTCRYDECVADADCTAMPNGVCAVGYPRSCLYGPCRVNADCARAAGGTCVIAVVGGTCAHPAVFCRYANDPCRQDSDCTGGMGLPRICVPKSDLQGTMCTEQPPPPS
jgi:hypothetical protein